MTTDVLSMYENIAGLTTKMASAARLSDWDGLSKLENQCASEARRMCASPLPALAGASRMRKIELLKKILANDREIRNVTEPWMTQLSKIMQMPRPVR
jgi:flagellar protein FliT